MKTIIILTGTAIAAAYLFNVLSKPNYYRVLIYVTNEPKVFYIKGDRNLNKLLSQFPDVYYTKEYIGVKTYSVGIKRFL